MSNYIKNISQIKNFLILWIFFLLVIIFTPKPEYKLIFPIKDKQVIVHDIKKNNVHEIIFKNADKQPIISEVNQLLDRRKFVIRSDKKVDEKDFENYKFNFLNPKILNLKIKNSILKSNIKNLPDVNFFEKLSIQPITGKPLSTIYVEFKSESQINFDEIKKIINLFEIDLINDQLQLKLDFYRDLNIKLNNELIIMDNISIHTKNLITEIIKDKLAEPNIFTKLESLIYDSGETKYAYFKINEIIKSIDNNIDTLKNDQLVKLNFIEINEFKEEEKISFVDIKIYYLIIFIMFCFFNFCLIFLNKKKLHYLFK